MDKPYVYGLFEGDVVAYIGKGTGRRLKIQERNFRLKGRVLKECKTETEAFAFERTMIAECKPLLNRCAGGNGGRRKKRRKLPQDPLMTLCERVGGKRVSVMILAWVNQVAPHCFSNDRLAKVCEANQCRIEYLTPNSFAIHAGR